MPVIYTGFWKIILGIFRSVEVRAGPSVRGDRVRSELGDSPQADDSADGLGGQRSGERGAGSPLLQVAARISGLGGSRHSDCGRGFETWRHHGASGAEESVRARGEHSLKSGRSKFP